MTRPVDKEIQTKTLHAEEVDVLRRHGLIPAGQYLDAVYLCRDTEYWTRWALRALLALGVVHLLAGVIFFFAYNWDNLKPVTKLAILQGGIFVSVVAAIIAKLDRAAGQALLIGASVLTGTLLAVIGQIYQTGADNYELFAMWALLIAPWVIASRSAAHWFLWLIISCLAFSLYAFQTLIPAGTLSAVELACLIALVTAAVLAMRELAVRSGASWLEADWTRYVLALGAVAIVFVPAIRYPLDFMPFIEYIMGTDAQVLGVLTFIAIVAALSVVYIRVLPDSGVIAISAGFFAIFLMTVGARLLNETIGFDWDVASRILPSLVLLVLWCAAVTAGTLKSLASVRRHISSGGSDD